MFGRRDHQHHHHGQQQRRRRKRDGCDGPDCGDCLPCDNPCLLNLSMLGLLALTAPARPPLARPSVPGRVGAVAIRGYQRWLSPVLPTACRHVPTCSSFGLEAVRRYGLLTGSRLTAGRIRRCTHAVPRGTADPVP